MQIFSEAMDKMFEEAGFPLPDKNVSEDCLLLNVHTTSISAKQPVLVWIHGGGFGIGNIPNHYLVFMPKQCIISMF